MDLQRKLEREHATLMKNAFRLARAYCEEHIDGKPDQFQYLETSARTFWRACNAVQSEEELIQENRRKYEHRLGIVLDRLSPEDRILLRHHFSKLSEMA